MSHGILKEYQVHGSVEFIVGGEGIQQGGVEVCPGLDGKVTRLAHTAGKVAEHIGFGHHLSLIQFLYFISTHPNGRVGRGRERQGRVSVSLLCSITKEEEEDSTNLTESASLCCNSNMIAHCRIYTISLSTLPKFTRNNWYSVLQKQLCTAFS